MQPKTHASGTLKTFIVFALTLLSVACAKRGPAIHDDPNLTPAERQELIEAQEKADALAGKVEANAEARKKEQVRVEKRMRSGYAVAQNSENLMQPISVDVKKNGQNATAEYDCFVTITKGKGGDVTIVQILDKKVTQEQFEKGEGRIAAYSIGKTPAEALQEFREKAAAPDSNATVTKTPEQPKKPDPLILIQQRNGTSGWGSFEKLGKQ